MAICPPRAHALCRPPSNCTFTSPILRLPPDGKRWRNDNGDPGLAFIYIDKDNDATIWVAKCRCKVFLKCPVARALARAADLGCDASSVVRRSASPQRKAPRVR